MHMGKGVIGLLSVSFLCASVAVASSGNERESAVTWSGAPEATAAILRTDAVSTQAATHGIQDSTIHLAQASGQGQPSGSALGYYLGLVDYKISTNWNPAASNVRAGAKVAVRFRVMRNGHVNYLAVETSSGDATLDRTAIDAIWKSTPLPPFPSLMTEPYLDLTYTFVMERG